MGRGQRAVHGVSLGKRVLKLLSQALKRADDALRHASRNHISSTAAISCIMGLADKLIGSARHVRD